MTEGTGGRAGSDDGGGGVGVDSVGLGDLDAREACDFEELDVDVSGEGAGDAAGVVREHEVRLEQPRGAAGDERGRGSSVRYE
jgi:hypothetical protein